jgi:hypothetical protein
MTLNRLELLLGWAAILVSAASAALVYFGGFIAPDSVAPDLIGITVILAALALGVTLDSVFDLLPARLLLGLATLVLAGVAVISFLFFLELATFLAVGATLLAFIRAYLRHHQTA